MMNNSGYGEGSICLKENVSAADVNMSMNLMPIISCIVLIADNTAF